MLFVRGGKTVVLINKVIDDGTTLKKPRYNLQSETDTTHLPEGRIQTHTFRLQIGCVINCKIPNVQVITKQNILQVFNHIYDGP